MIPANFSICLFDKEIRSFLFSLICFVISQIWRFHEKRENANIIFNKTSNKYIINILSFGEFQKIFSADYSFYKNYLNSCFLTSITDRGSKNNKLKIKYMIISLISPYSSRKVPMFIQ